MTDFIIHPSACLVNCMLVPIGDKLYIIDPMPCPKSSNWQENSIFGGSNLLTHAHVDPIGAVEEVAQALNVKTVYCIA